MSKPIRRMVTAVKRALARADTILAILMLVFAGRASASESWISMTIFGVIGLVFLVASGDYSWRKGFVAGKHARSE